METRERDRTIRSWIDKPFFAGAPGVRPCWEFCRRCVRLWDIRLPDSGADLRKNDGPAVAIPAIVLFAVAGDWHAGVVWPDGLHFIHAKPMDPAGSRSIVRQERLTEEPWQLIMKGIYDVE